MPSSERPIRVAIVGGGCASVAVAFELTRPEQRGRYQVTLYQQGFRLGGKGASGRGVADRIEEHGLHLWMGFYENAFRLVRECYAELGRDPATCRIADWRDAFRPDPFTGVAEQTAGGEWTVWSAHLPPADGLPGDPIESSRPFSVMDYALRSVQLLRTVFASLARRAPRADDSRRWIRYAELAALGAMSEAALTLEAVLRGSPGGAESSILRFLDSLGSGARAEIERLVEHDLELRRLWTIADLTLATLRGMVRFRLVSDPRGFEAIDDYDCREWLQLNGASETSLASGYLRALYDLGFSYEDGDVSRPRIAAGQALRAMVRAFFTYRGAFFWKMQAGMGDVVFAPLYEVLRRRGVRFEFFHRLENVVVRDLAAPAGAARAYVESLEFSVQARVRGSGVYEPLVDVRGLPCWPAAPDFAQLEDGARLREEAWDFESFWDTRNVGRRSLQVARDFDLVVLGVGLGAIPHVCRELVAKDPRWRALVDHVKTVPTQALQLWLDADMKQLGWDDPAINLSGFVHPFDTWADMGHLLREESWRVPPRALAYFCSVLPEGDAPSTATGALYALAMRERVRHNSVSFLEKQIAHLWPGAVGPDGGFRWELLADPARREAASGGAPSGPERLQSQYWTANVNPSDRYALSLPGSLRYRISPLDPTYDNMTIAGDWTDCGFNAGCVEAAVMSGRLAAHALSGSPALAQIVGYDHP